MTVHMTADTLGTDDNDQPWSDSSLAPLEEDPMAITHTFLQEQNKFYSEFVQSNSYYHNATMQHKTNAITAATNEIAQPRSKQQPPMNVAMQTTLPQPCPSLKQSITLIQMAPPASNPLSSQSVSPCYSPMTVQLTTAPFAADTNDPPWPNSSIMFLEEITNEEFLQQWNKFYSEFVQSNQFFSAMKPWCLQPP